MRQPRAILWVAVSSGAQAEEEKESLPEQERRLREIAADRGWQIVDLITVPGHSRVYFNYPEFAAAAAAEGMSDPARMFEHWKRRDFDVFACVAGDRFGRSASIFNEVVERTYDAGAQVFTIRDGLIERGNENTWAVMASYAASSEVRELKRRYQFGMNRRAAEGKPLSPRVRFSHQIIRDARGKAVTMVVREELRPLFNDIATILLERVAWTALERVLFERYGHVADNGKPFPMYALYHLLNAPSFWGNSARHAPADCRGDWVFDEGAPVPEGVTVYYGTHEAVYTGELAEAVKAELRRRRALRGSARPDTQYPLSALFACDECGYKLAWTNSNGRWRGARCNTAYVHRPYTTEPCAQRQHMPEPYALDYMRQLVTLIVTTGDVQTALASLATPEPPDETPELERQLAQLEAEGHTLIQNQLRAPASMSRLYEEQIDVLGTRIEAVRERLTAAKQRQPSDAVRASRHAALTELQALGEVFWQQSPGKVNQVLRRVFAGWVFMVRDGAICGVQRVQ
jgi:DNA invertase Pin-like site-specific DNA recombinase